MGILLPGYTHNPGGLGFGERIGDTIMKMGASRSTLKIHSIYLWLLTQAICTLI